MAEQTPVSSHGTRAKRCGESTYEQLASPLAALQPERLAAKGCRGRRHGRVSRQSKQTEQK